jgi:hypothetical protein
LKQILRMVCRHYADEDARESEDDRAAEDDGHDGPEDDVRETQHREGQAVEFREEVVLHVGREGRDLAGPPNDFLAPDQQIVEQKAENPAPNHRS